VFFHVEGRTYTPHQMRWEGSSHWFLRTPEGRVVDLTVEQFQTTPDYTISRGRGFLTKDPSNRARKLAAFAGLLIDHP
jgi:hypothetical protein